MTQEPAIVQMAKAKEVSLAFAHELVDDSAVKFMEEDRISQMPDQVLVSILSLLTLKEAARTSVLSHRWEKLWTSFTGSLNFDATQALFQMLECEELGWEQGRHKYVNWVDQVLTSLDCSSSIFDEFRVCFDIDEKYSSHIDRWIDFAMEKRISKIQFNFARVFSDTASEYYTLKQPSGLYNITALRSLCLRCVDISGELIEFFLSNCPLLEWLSVKSSKQLVNLKITGVTLPLKYLEISLCFNLERLEILAAPNLESLVCIGGKVELHVENVPRLVEVSTGGSSGGSVNYMLHNFSKYFSQLEVLHLDMNLAIDKAYVQPLQLIKLKHLILKVSATFERTLLEWTSLINASPCLHKFTLELYTANPSRGRKMREVTKCPHQCLKVVEIVGFVGYATDVELLMYMFANASTLEKVILDRRQPLMFGTPWEWEENEKKGEAKKRAMKLKRNLPSGVDLVVI